MNAYELERPERKLVMWYKVKELSEKACGRLKYVAKQDWTRKRSSVIWE